MDSTVSFDAPPEDTSKRPAEVRPVKDGGERASFDELFAPAPFKSEAISEVNNIGQISRMKLPVDFETGQQRNGTVGASSRREFRSAKDPDFKILLEYRGTQVSDSSAAKFKEVLAAPAHSLSAEELNDMREILRQKSDKSLFAISKAATYDIDGKRVLAVEGKYPEHNMVAMTLYLNAGASGAAVQEVTLQGSSGSFIRHRSEGLAAIQSIKWKK
ncbi:hypothetical protein KBI23_24325 [bacterium]|nr:hypothetical protein [bacterium]